MFSEYRLDEIEIHQTFGKLQQEVANKGKVVGADKKEYAIRLELFQLVNGKLLRVSNAAQGSILGFLNVKLLWKKWQNNPVAKQLCAVCTKDDHLKVSEAKCEDKEGVQQFAVIAYIGEDIMSNPDQAAVLGFAIVRPRKYEDRLFLYRGTGSTSRNMLRRIEGTATQKAENVALAGIANDAGVSIKGTEKSVAKLFENEPVVDNYFDHIIEITNICAKSITVGTMSLVSVIAKAAICISLKNTTPSYVIGLNVDATGNFNSALRLDLSNHACFDGPFYVLQYVEPVVGSTQQPGWRVASHADKKFGIPVLILAPDNRQMCLMYEDKDEVIKAAVSAPVDANVVAVTNAVGNSNNANADLAQVQNAVDADADSQVADAIANVLNPQPIRAAINLPSPTHEDRVKSVNLATELAGITGQIEDMNAQLPLMIMDAQFMETQKTEEERISKLKQLYNSLNPKPTTSGEWVAKVKEYLKSQTDILSSNGEYLMTPFLGIPAGQQYPIKDINILDVTMEPIFLNGSKYAGKARVNSALFSDLVKDTIIKEKGVREKYHEAALAELLNAEAVQKEPLFLEAKDEIQRAKDLIIRIGEKPQNKEQKTEMITAILGLQRFVSLKLDAMQVGKDNRKRAIRKALIDEIHAVEEVMQRMVDEYDAPLKELDLLAGIASRESNVAPTPAIAKKDLQTLDDMIFNLSNDVSDLPPLETVVNRTILVKNLAGKTLTIPFNEQMTVLELKNFINSQWQVPAEQQRLIYGMDQLQNDRTVQSYVGNNTSNVINIHMILSLRPDVQANNVTTPVANSLPPMVANTTNATTPVVPGGLPASMFYNAPVSATAQVTSPVPANLQYLMTAGKTPKVGSPMVNNVVGYDPADPTQKSLIDTLSATGLFGTASKQTRAQVQKAKEDAFRKHIEQNPGLTADQKAFVLQLAIQGIINPDIPVVGASASAPSTPQPQGFFQTLFK